jgi:hypothetical protein
VKFNVAASTQLPRIVTYPSSALGTSKIGGAQCLVTREQVVVSVLLVFFVK